MLILAYDVGTSGVKTCLYRAGSELNLVNSRLGTYDLTIFPNGGAEQDPDQWWDAIVETTRELTRENPREM